MSIPAYKYQLANPGGLLNVQHTKLVPNIGAKLKVIDDVGFNRQELRKLIGLKDIVTVSEVNPIVIGENGNYHWEYEIYTEDFGDDVMLLGWHYELL